MATIAAPRASGRGRQAAAVEAERDLRLELVAQLAEGRTFAERMLAVGRFLSTPRPSNVVVNLGGELVYAATRRLTQIGSVVL